MPVETPGDISDHNLSRYELLVLHRLKELEANAKDVHKAFEELRIDVVTSKSKNEVRMAGLAAGVSLFITVVVSLLPHFLK